MVLGFDICGLQGCNRLLPPIPIACPNCFEVPDSDIHSPNTDYGYCCYDHLSCDSFAHAATTCRERCSWRTMIRTAAICNMALMCVQMKLFICHITSDHAISSEIRNVGIEQRKEGQWWCEGIWPAGILGAASFSNCIKSIQFMTPLLAWLLEDKAVRIDEYTVEPIKTRQIHLLMLGNPVAFIADLHSFLTMTPTLGTPGPKDGIVVDVSSMQYESTVRSHRASHYHDTRTRGRHTPEPFGSFFKEHREALEDESSSIEDNQCSFILEAQLRTMNNAIYREAQRLGGRPYLFSMRHWDFVSAMDSIGRVLCGALEELRPRTEDLIFQDRRRDAFQQLVDDCNGEGHRAMNEAAMKRMVAAKTEKKNL